MSFKVIATISVLFIFAIATVPRKISVRNMSFVSSPSVVLPCACTQNWYFNCFLPTNQFNFKWKSWKATTQKCWKTWLYRENVKSWGSITARTLHSVAHHFAETIVADLKEKTTVIAGKMSSWTYDYIWFPVELTEEIADDCRPWRFSKQLQWASANVRVRQLSKRLNGYAKMKPSKNITAKVVF